MDEFNAWINESRDIQDFVLRYTGVQTISRAKLVYAEYCQYWSDLFISLSVEYFGVRYVELVTLKEALNIELAGFDAEIRNTLYNLMAYEGEEIIDQANFEQMMRVWASFSANDINEDNVLDNTEIKMMWWLLEG